MGITAKIAVVIPPPPIPPPSIKPEAQGRRLRALLAKLKWSQRDLARHTGLSESDISKYCKGHKPIEGVQARKIADKTGLTTDYILWGSIRGLPLDVIRELTAGDD